MLHCNDFCLFWRRIFSVTIDKNKLVLVNVEERWHLFGETEYVFHFSYAETGRVVERIVIYYLLNFLLFRFLY